MIRMYADVCSQMNTGDILVFEGNANLDYMINLLEDGKYSHVGMVIRSADNKLLFWDAPGGGTLFADPYKNDDSHAGCRVAGLESILDYYMQVENPYFTWRPLVSPNIKANSSSQPGSRWDLLQKFVEDVVGTPFPGDNFVMPEDVQIWFKKHMPDIESQTGVEIDHGIGMLLTYLTGRVLRLPVEGCFFCAQLIAQTYMAMGLLPLGPQPANGYAPANFVDQPTRLELNPGVQLGPPVTVQWPKLTPATEASAQES